MAETARRLATWEDLLALTDDGRTYEIIDGVLEALAHPYASHWLAQSLVPGSWSDPSVAAEEAQAAGGW
jgi:hypothetical protein